MTIYLDNLAATPIDPRVAERHRAAMSEHSANANSAEHRGGADAHASVAAAERSVAAAFGDDAQEVTFTPGASAALWLAVEDAVARAGSRVARVAATAVEHPSLLAALRRAERAGRVHVTVIPVDASGAPRLHSVETVLAEGVDLLCAMAVNNEVGTVTDLTAVIAMADAHGARTLVDASQAAGRIDFQPGDLTVVSGAKMYGPRRAGALIGTLSKATANLAHEVFGSPDGPAATALAHALALRLAEREADEARIAVLRDTLEAQLVDAVPGLRVNGALSSRIAGSLHVSTPHLPGDAAVARLWGRVDLSTGAACQSGVAGPSHVLSAMDVEDWVREGAVRIGIGRFNTEDEIDAAGAMIAAALTAEPARLRA